MPGVRGAFPAASADMQSLNVTLLHWMAAGHEPTDWVLFAGCVIARCGATVGVVLMAWAMWRRPDERGYVAAVWIAAGAASVLSDVVANQLDLQRPFALGLVPAHIPHGASAALPSSHASVMATVALTFLRNAALRGTGIVLMALALLTGWARIHVGVHFPFDILAGFLLAGVLTGLFATAHRVVRRPGRLAAS